MIISYGCLPQSRYLCHVTRTKSRVLHILKKTITYLNVFLYSYEKYLHNEIICTFDFYAFRLPSEIFFFMVALNNFVFFLKTTITQTKS